MAMDVGGAKGGLKADINVTPLVDVMLVLLIIVILIAPMLQKGVDVALPEADHTLDKPDTSDQIVVHVDVRSQLYVNGLKQASIEDVVARLQTVLESAKDRTVYLKGDRDAPYGAIMSMMDALRKAGIETVGLITERRGGNLPSEKGGQ
jgi:biopolymer transport protein TolR